MSTPTSLHGHSLRRRLTLLATIIAAGGCTLAATQIGSPYLARLGWLGPAALALVGLCAALWGWRRPGALSKALAIWGVALLTLVAAVRGDLAQRKARVLSTPRAQLSRWGRHLVVGYRDVEELKTLLERTELGGVYITARNVRGRSLQEVRREIDSLQAIQRRHGGKPLWVMADQEGGKVSRLSPPLPPLATLAEVARGERWRAAVAEHARRSARGLRDLGVTMNLAPVVDLRTDLDRGLDLHTCLHERAIAADPQRVADVAALYAEVLSRHGVMATAKHFPGLGYVAQDTHHSLGWLPRSEAQLMAAEWLPFARLAQGRAPSAVMLAHTVVPSLDRRPASSSKILVQRLRRRLGHRGVVITDDMCMAPVVYSRGGIAARSAEALAAGVDLLLISYDPRQVYTVLAAATRWSKEQVPPATLRESRTRLASMARALVAGARQAYSMAWRDTPADGLLRRSDKR